ncbi:hypothetical protein SLA2020_005390 [Shorea laevis]
MHEGWVDKYRRREQTSYLWPQQARRFPLLASLSYSLSTLPSVSLKRTMLGMRLQLSWLVLLLKLRC